MKIVIAADSFKGSLTSFEACQAIEKGILEVEKYCKVISLPLSDGGEGFADCMERICNGNRLYTKCHDIYRRTIDAHIVTVGKTAIIDAASASGIQTKKNVMTSSSYGTGELIKYAVSKGYSDIILGLGGTGCCDGGAGAIEALGGKFLDENQMEIKGIRSRDLNSIFGINLMNIVKDINFTFACDVENELFGKNGAAYIFAPQKGAGKTDVQELDNGLRRLNAFFKTDVAMLKGGGAAGGLCAGLYALYGGRIKSGFDILAEHTNLESLIKQCDIVVTGEGKTDAQTLMGKLPFRIAEMAKQHSKKCVIISGIIDGVDIGDKMISLVGEGVTAEYAIANASELLTKKAKLILQ